MTSTDRSTLTVRSIADLLAAVPYLLGFHPADSVVVVALRGKRIVFVARGDLPTGDPAEIRAAAEQLAAVVARQDVEVTAIIGYGQPTAVTPSVTAVRAALDRCGLPALDVLRVTDGRFWSYACADPGCCPPEGRPFDAATSQLAAAATYAGKVALPDRAALARQVAPLGGRERRAMRHATRRAEQRLGALLAAAPPADPLGERMLRRAGRSAVRTALDRYRAGARLTTDEVAWLGLLLNHVPVRDHAWRQIGGEEWQLTLWTDVLRRVEPDQVAAPASLLAFAAWRQGQGALACVAVERALRAQPDYPLALLLDEALRRGLPPATLDGWPS